MQVAGFIKDFHLQVLDGRICFPAKIDFIVNHEQASFKGEVLIITEKENTCVYIFNASISYKKFPIFIIKTSNNFKHIPNQCLIIDGKDEVYGSYKIIIVPLNKKDQSDKKAKKWNVFISVLISVTTYFLVEIKKRNNLSN